jgi:hypothetical protein
MYCITVNYHDKSWQSGTYRDNSLWYSNTKSWQSGTYHDNSLWYSTCNTNSHDSQEHTVIIHCDTGITVNYHGMFLIVMTVSVTCTVSQWIIMICSWLSWLSVTVSQWIINSHDSLEHTVIIHCDTVTLSHDSQEYTVIIHCDTVTLSHDSQEHTVIIHYYHGIFLTVMT